MHEHQASGINRWEIGSSIARFLGMKGWAGANQFSSAPISAHLGVGDLTRTPYLRYGEGVGRSFSALATAGQFAWVAAIPGRDKILVIDHVHVVNYTGVARLVSLRILTAADSALQTVVTSSAMASLGGEVTGPVQRSSRVGRGASAAGMTTAFDLAQFNIPAQGNILYPLPQPVILAGGQSDLLNQRPWLAVEGNAVNTDFTVNFIGSEWPERV